MLEVGPPTPQEVNHEEAEPIVAQENPPALSHKSSRSSVVSFHEEVKVSALYRSKVITVNSR